MIEYFTRKELDIKKYDGCIAKAFNSRIYAYSWYLNIVCDDWAVLVKDDYTTVMPLPIRKKMGLHYIYQAPWIQQLGVFSSTSIDKMELANFINAIPKRFKLIDVFLNSENSTNSSTEVRSNYVLSLKQKYKDIKKRYSKGRKSSIKTAQNSNLDIVENYNHHDIIQLFKANKGAELTEGDANYAILNKLINYALPLNLAQSFGVFNADKKLIGGAFFLRDTYRITYLFSALNEEGRALQAMSFLLDYIIKNNAESNLIFDFEGSMIKGVARFCKSFGVEKEVYYHYKKYQLY